MGTTLWSDAHYHRRALELQAAGKTAFGYNDDIRAQRVAARVHPLMDPAKLKGGRRESRDSNAHPVSNAVSVLFDVTGSMHAVPRILQQNLSTLFDLLWQKNYLEDPAILVGGIGDATCDLAPLQIGQFEAGNEIEDDLSRLFLEGGGGGQKRESYELALYFLARKASMDCWEKRGRKGFAFIIGDEMPYQRVKRREVEHVFGDSLRADIPIRDIVAEVQEKFELFFILPNLTAYYDDPSILKSWRQLLGDRVLRLSDPAGISELIAATIGLTRGVASWDSVAADLRVAGTDEEVVRAVGATVEGIRPDDVPDLGLTPF